MSSARPLRLLFVCLGNICRSPLAEAVVARHAHDRGIQQYFTFASAGTGDWHIGCGADPRSVETARRFGLDLSRHRARQITAGNLNQWDWFVAMDRQNRLDLLDLGAADARVVMMRQFEAPGEPAADVPDPYYAGPEGFEQVYKILHANAAPLLDYFLRMV